MVGFVDLLFQAACDFGSSERFPRFLIKDISIYLLHTVGQTLNAAEANRIAKDLYDVDFHYSGKKKKKNVIRFAETSVSSSTIHDISTQYLLVSKIEGLLAEMVFSQQIKSPDSLYPHVKKAVHALKVAFSGTQCVVGGELINVDWSASASACLYDHRGTTNYMNAILQCLHCVSELKSALFEWQPLFEKSSDHLLTAATRSHFLQLDKNAMAVAPSVFLQLFRKMYPTSKQVDNHNPKDAEACWGQLLGTLSQSLKSTGFSSENFSTVNDLFDIKLVSRKMSYEVAPHCPCGKGEMLLRKVKKENHNNGRLYYKCPKMNEHEGSFKWLNDWLVEQKKEPGQYSKVRETVVNAKAPSSKFNKSFVSGVFYGCGSLAIVILSFIMYLMWMVAKKDAKLCLGLY